MKLFEDQPLPRQCSHADHNLKTRPPAVIRMTKPAYEMIVDGGYQNQFRTQYVCQVHKELAQEILEAML